MESIQKERKPYNPYHLAGGYAAESLPDKKTIAVFKCYCNHTDFMGGSVSISLPTVMRETGYSYRAVCYADAVLTSLGRITKKSRGIGGQRGGRQSSITTVFCTAEELQKAGANDENFFSLGGKAGLFKVQTQPIQSAKRVYSKRKQDGFKVQRDALEPLKSEPFLPQPIKAEPLKAENQKPSQNQNPASLRSKEGKENQSQPREPQENITPAGRTKPVKGSAPRAKRPAPRAAFKPEVEENFRMAGAPDIWFEAMASLTVTIDILNGDTLCGCPYPLQSWATIAKKHPLLKAAQLWTPIFKNGQLEYSDGSSLADQIMARRSEELKTPEDKEKSAAHFWWGSLELKKMHELVPDELWVGDSFGRGAPGSAILAAYREHAPKRKPQPVPAKKTPVDQLSYVDLDAVNPEFA